MRRYPFTRHLVLIALAPVACANTARAQYDIRDAKVYVKMDFWQSAEDQSAEAWHFDPNNNGVWTKLSSDPDPPNGRPRAQFEVQDLFLAELMQSTHVWFLGVPEIRVVSGEPGSFVDRSDDAQYTEMIDRMIFASATGQGFHDPCGNRSWPIATGSELTPYLLHPHPGPKPYGMRMAKDGLLASIGWLWMNPAGVEEADVYIEFTLIFDMVDVADPPQFRRVDVVVSWISAAGGCDYNFCLNHGQSSKVGTPFPVPDGVTAYLVLAVPHVKDHTSVLRLYHRYEDQNTLLIDSPINNLNSHHAAHKCEPDGGTHAWHNHSSVAAAHLPVGGLAAHQVVIRFATPGWDHVFTAASFDVPAHSTASPTNHRALYMVFWYGTIVPEE